MAAAIRGCSLSSFFAVSCAKLTCANARVPRTHIPRNALRITPPMDIALTITAHPLPQQRLAPVSVDVSFRPQADIDQGWFFANAYRTEMFSVRLVSVTEIAYCLNSTRRVTHAEDYRRRHGFHGWRHASARRADRGSNQGLQVRRLGDALFRSSVRRRARPRLQGEIRPAARPQDLRDFRRVLALLRRRSPWRHRQAVQRHQEVRGFALRRGRYELGGLGAPARHRRREAPEAGRRPKPRHPGQYRTRPRAARQGPGRRYEHLHSPGRAWRRQKAVRRRLGAAFVQAD